MKLLLSTYFQILLWLSTSKHGEGAVTVLPSGIASVCSGDSLELNCSTSGNIHEWTIAPISATVPYTRGLSTTNQPPEPLVIDSTRFIFSRLSATNSLPLVSTLLIDPVNTGLNGTVVSCTDAETSETVSTTVTIINEDWIGEPALKSGIRQASEEVFEGDGVTITLKWDQWKPLYSYFIDIIPSVPVMTGNMSVTIKLSYNIQYNVSVIAMHLCGESNISIFTQLFHYTNCGNPAVNMTNENITVVGYRNPAVEGSTVYFICPPGLELVGSRTSTCVVNEEWRPDPRVVECKDNKANKQRSSASTDVLVALVTIVVFVVTAIIFFAVGFLCRHFCQKEKNQDKTVPSSVNVQDAQQSHRMHELELQTNVAYENIPMN